MLGSRLFWKLFLGFTLVSGLTVLTLVSSSWSWQRDETEDLARRGLRTAAKLIEPAAADWAVEPSDAAAGRLRTLAENAEVMLTVAPVEGEPLRAGVELDDAASPPTRVSLPLTRDGRPVGRLSLARPAEPLAATLAKLWRRYATYTPLLLMAMVSIGYLLVAHLVGPVQELNAAATAMVGGNYRQRAFVANRDELGVLARSFNQMSEELGRRLSELEESDRRQATVLGGMIEGVIAIDDRGYVRFANPAAGKLFGFFPPQVVGRPLIEAVRNHPLYEASTTAVEAGTPQRLEIAWEEQVFSVQVTPLVSTQATGAVIVLHDTTELRRLEGLRRDFVANVSHELKTPLSTIKANAETLLRGAVDDKQHRDKFLRGIDEQSDRLADLIQDMLNLARIESAQQPFAIHSVPVADAVADCLRGFSARAEARQIVLNAAGDGLDDPASHDDESRDEDSPDDAAGPTLVKADREGLRVILSNLVDNAIKYSPEGGTVGVAWRTHDEPQGRMVVIEVTDTGAGIPEEKQGRVFERFYRVDEARSRHLGGTGLGLSIVKHLAQAFGGGVAVENAPDGGARFTVTLPAA